MPRRAGPHVRIIDGEVERLHHETIAATVAPERPDSFGITSTAAQATRAFALAHAVKARARDVRRKGGGGPHQVRHPECLHLGRPLGAEAPARHRDLHAAPREAGADHVDVPLARQHGRSRDAGPQEGGVRPDLVRPRVGVSGGARRARHRHDGGAGECGRRDDKGRRDQGNRSLHDRLAFNPSAADHSDVFLKCTDLDDDQIRRLFHKAMRETVLYNPKLLLRRISHMASVRHLGQSARAAVRLITG